jgi:predicted DNA-binding transcriptional regulator AlpA
MDGDDRNTIQDAGRSGPELLTLAMIRQDYLPIAERTIFRLISSGKFPPADIRLGGKIRLWRRSTVETWINDQAGPQRAA